MNKTDRIILSNLFISLIILSALFLKIIPNYKDISVSSAVNKVNTKVVKFSELKNRNNSYTGFLLTTLNRTENKESLIDLKPKAFRTVPSLTFNHNKQVDVAKEAGIEHIEILLFNEWNYRYKAVEKNVYPGDNGNWKNWENLVRDMINLRKESGMEIVWDIWNEPDYKTFFPRNRKQFNEMWKRAFQIIRNEDPEMKISGPSVATFDNKKVSVMSFLNYANKNGLMPDFITWHELEAGIEAKNIVSRAKKVRKWLDTRGYTDVKIVVNEFTPQNKDTSSSLLLEYLIEFEKSVVDYAMLACWETDSCWGYTLNYLLTKSLQKTPRYWVMYYYASLGDKLIDLPINNKSILASFDSSSNTIKILATKFNAKTNRINIKNGTRLLNLNEYSAKVIRVPAEKRMKKPTSAKTEEIKNVKVVKKKENIIVEFNEKQNHRDNVYYLEIFKK